MTNLSDRINSDLYVYNEEIWFYMIGI